MRQALQKSPTQKECVSIRVKRKRKREKDVV